MCIRSISGHGVKHAGRLVGVMVKQPDSLTVPICHIVRDATLPSYAFLNGHVSASYITAGFSTVLYTFFLL